MTKSKAEILAALPEQERTAILKHYSQDELNLLQYDWDFWARPKQMIPAGKWSTWLISAGRGFGKTRTGAETIARWQNPSKQTYSASTIKGYGRFALVGQTVTDIRDTMLFGESGLINIAPPYNKPVYIASRKVVEWPNGAVAHLYSGDEPDQLRGPQQHKAWVDELVKFKYAEDTWDMLQFGLRLGDNPQTIVTTTPKPTPTIKQLVVDPDVVVTTGSSYENMSNLSDAFIKAIIKKYEGTRLGRQEIYAEILGDVEGALWNTTNIEQNRVDFAPSLAKVVISVDPAVTSTETSDAAGIVACGIDSYKHGYVLEDATIKDTPAAWAKKAIELYHKYKADYVLAEINNGGDLIETVINFIDPRVPVRTVYASRNKYTRATPVATLYEKNVVHHVGVFPKLEEELTEWEPGNPSPNRLDAVVWGFTDLLLTENPIGILKAIRRPF